MSVIHWLVVQEICSRFEFARRFESHLAWPPPFYMRMRTTISDEHSIITMLRIIFSTYSFNACTDSACTYSDHVQCHVEPTKRHKTRRAVGEELIVVQMLQERFLPLRKIKGNIFSALRAVTRLLHSLESALPISFALLRLCVLRSILLYAQLPGVK